MPQGPRTEEPHRLRDTRLALPDKSCQKTQNKSVLASCLTGESQADVIADGQPRSRQGLAATGNGCQFFFSRMTPMALRVRRS